MKKLLLALSAVLITMGCANNEAKETASSEVSQQNTGQSGVVDDVSNPNIVQVASQNQDFSTLVTAVKAAELVDALSNAGPFTVFAPTNAAFEKLPKGTVEGLLKPDKKDDLSNILGYHTYVGVLDGVLLQDGISYDMVYGGKVQITHKEGKNYVNGSEIVGTVKTSNGVIHVINDVLLPK